MRPTTFGTEWLRRGFVIVGLLWLSVLLAGAEAARTQGAPVLAFSETDSANVDPAVECTPTSCPVGPHDAAFSPDGSLLAVVNNTSSTLAMFTVGPGGTLTEVHSPSFSPSFAIPAGGLAPNSVDFSPSGKLIAAVNITSNDVSVFSVGEGGVLTFIGAFDSGGSSAYWGAFSPNGDWFAVANRTSNNVSIFKVEDNGHFTLEKTFGTGGGLQTNVVAFSPDGTLLATGNINTNDVSMFQFDEANGDEHFVGRFSTGVGGQSAWNIAFSPNGALLATANPGDNSVTVFHVLSTGALQVPAVRTQLDPGRLPRGVEFSPGGTLLATADFGEPSPDTGGTASVFSVGSGGALTQVAGSPFPAGAGSKHTSFAPKGDLFATVNYGENTVTVFRAAAVEITKRAQSTVDPGGVVSYTVTVTNTGALEVSGPVVDNLAGVIDRATLVGTPTTGNVTVDLPARTLTWNGTLAPAVNPPLP